MFEGYFCGVTGLPCCGCSFWCEHRKKIKPLKENQIIRKGVNMDELAIQIVKDYTEEHLDKSDGDVTFTVFIVWKCKTLQNWKWLLSTTLFDGMYYEVTFNGDTGEFYLDAYKKFENRVISYGKGYKV